MKLMQMGAVVLTALALAACSNTPEETEVTPSETTTQVPENSVQYFTTVVGDRVLFGFDSSSIDGIAQDTLRRQAEWLLANPAVTIVIEGHADERGTREYNLALGARRANATLQFLVGQGIDPSRITTVTFGKERPDAVCSNESCWSVNRRAVTVVAGAPLS
ncbi:MAG: peptidoglycan-associated lipoprotein Pal [Pseudomonadota bacterium]